jgi:hypothetical protein
MRKMTKIWTSVLVFLLFTSVVAGEPPEASQDKPPRKKTNLNQKDRQAWRKILKWSQECDDAYGDHGEDEAGLRFYPLAARKYLVEVECEVAAYQSEMLYLLYDENASPARSRLLTFKIYTGETEQSMKQIETGSLLGESAFDDQRKTLTVFYRLSRLGACGTVATYSFPRGVPMLTDFRVKFTCDGEGEEDKSSWKRIEPRSTKPSGRRGR